MIYHDREGRPTTLDKLCREEPEWAANVIRYHLKTLGLLWEIMTGSPLGELTPRERIVTLLGKRAPWLPGVAADPERTEEESE